MNKIVSILEKLATQENSDIEQLIQAANIDLISADALRNRNITTLAKKLKLKNENYCLVVAPEEEVFLSNQYKNLINF